jgi:hypothetical protein
MLGYYHDHSQAHDSFMPLFPMRYDGLQTESSDEQAWVQTVLPGGENIHLRCFYQQMGHQRLRSFRGHEYVVALAYFCPVRDEQHCTLLNRRNGPSSGNIQSLNVSLTTVYHHSGLKEGFDVRSLVWRNAFSHDHRPPAESPGTVRAELANYFLFKALPSLPKPSSTVVAVPNVAAITTICYGSAFTDRQSAMNIISQKWVEHYRRLNFRVVIHDVVGQRTDYANESLIDYHPFSILSLLGVSPSGGHGARKYDPSTKYNDKLHLLYDSDKVNTYTHARFEMAAVYDIDFTLIIDFDEFLYCKKGIPGTTVMNSNTYEAQIRLIGELLAANKDKSNEISLADLVPHKIVDMPIQACMKSKSEAGESIFSCISTIDRAVVNSPKLKKGFHTRLACPYTHFHTAGLFHRDINPYWCEGPITYPPAHMCTIVHFEFKTANRYVVNTELPPNELASMV